MPALLVLLAASIASAQTTTTISGKVYDPRTTAASLPIHNVLVYITTNTVPVLPSGAQCLTFQAPADAVSYAYTITDGTFTIPDVPVNTTYTLVIQAGKWRRQFTQAVVTTPITGLALHMPANHTQGDIPMIAIATGNVDGVECVLLHMGIDQAEFTDDSGVTGGRIHLYQGSGGTSVLGTDTANGGAVVSAATTPSESSLIDNLNKLNSYDLVMFPCQGAAVKKSSAEMSNIVSYTTKGGRLFTTHYSYDWLVPDATFNSPFPPVANWTYSTEKSIATGTGTIATDFNDGTILAQWLKNSGATVADKQISIGTIRTDVGSVIAPTQSWLGNL